MGQQMSAIPARIDQVTLAVDDVDRSARFYADAFGFPATDDDPGSGSPIRRFTVGAITLTLIDKGLLLEEMHLSGFPNPPGPVTLAVVVARDEVEHYVQQGEAAGARVIAPAEDKASGPRIGFLGDPDGHVWEILGL
jgi:catechol 2,3-dioxygenase-like lactoylglutathione lyase family enzyme